MENEKLVREALDEISGGADSFVEGFKSLSSGKKAAIIGGLIAILAGTAAASYEAGTGGKHIKKLLGKDARYCVDAKTKKFKKLSDDEVFILSEAEKMGLYTKAQMDKIVEKAPALKMPEEEKENK